MKKIIPFILFPVLLFFFVYWGFNQTKNATIVRTQEKNQVTTTPIPTSIISSPTISPKTTDEINLIIKSPESGTTVDSSSIEIAGSTEANATIMINDSEVQAAKDGSFKTTVLLDEGDNYISVVAYNELGSVSEREILITRTIAGL